MIDTYSVPLTNLVKEFDLTVEFASTDYHSIRLTVEDVSRPGIQLAGYFDHFDPMRLQVLGNVEMSYLYRLSDQARATILDRLFSYKFPALLITRNLSLSPQFLEMAKKHNVTLLRSVTIECWACSHWGRVFFKRLFLRKSLENCDDISMLKPQKVTGYFADNELFALYDTYARFERMKKDVADGNVLTAEEIINRRVHDTTAYNGAKFSFKGKRFLKKIKK